MKLAALMVVLFTSIGGVHADELQDEASKFCEKMKQCALAQMGGQDIPPNMKAMIEQNLDSACANMRDQFKPAMQGHAMYQPALQCLRSMNELSCAEIQESAGDAVTPECAEYQRRAESYQ